VTYLIPSAPNPASSSCILFSESPGEKLASKKLCIESLLEATEVLLENEAQRSCKIEDGSEIHLGFYHTGDTAEDQLQPLLDHDGSQVKILGSDGQHSVAHGDVRHWGPSFTNTSNSGSEGGFIDEMLVPS